MIRFKLLSKLFVNIILILGILMVPAGSSASTVQAAPAVGLAASGAAAPAAQAAANKASALVLVNSGSSEKYPDFEHFIQPYLNHFGIPYTVLDINNNDLPADLNSYALIIIGHAQIDTGATAKLSAAEQDAIVAAVRAGTGLVNFDNDLSADHSTDRYPFIHSIFGFSYNSDNSGSNVRIPTANLHWITSLHSNNDLINTKTAMNLAGISLPITVSSLATSGTQPLLAATNSGIRAVQFGSYDWMSYNVKGPLAGLDDLVWRSMVWAARKPFVMQGLPPFVTFRMDGVSQPTTWAPQVNSAGFKPWMGLYTNSMDAAQITGLKTLVDSGMATAGLYSFALDDYVYFNHFAGSNFSDAQIAANYTAATNWFTSNGIAISKYMAPKYYEIGTNAFAGLTNWGVEFVGLTMDPGQVEATANWMNAGPFRKYETKPASADQSNPYNVIYTDYVPFANTSPYYNQFFNCVTEPRDADPVTNYDWDPMPNSPVSPGGVELSTINGTRYLTRALNSMTLATLFSHEVKVNDVSSTEFQTIMDGIAQNLQSYNPEFVTLDEACKYVRAVTNSQISSATFNTGTNQLTTSLSGKTDTQTRFYVFGQQNGSIVSWMVNVDPFETATTVNYTVPALDSPVDPNQGPGGPILVISSSSNPFSKYYAEILRAEGLNAFYVLDISSVDASVLANYDLAILGDMSLTDSQVTMLNTWVTGGGNLIAMHPDKKLAGLLGLTDQASTLSNGYMRTLSNGLGIFTYLTERIQFHGTADLYAASAGTTVVAGLYPDVSSSTTYPGITMRPVGTSGGHAAAFAYDLARSVVYTRQGNPAWAGQERDGKTPIRPNDLFFGARVGDVQPDWVNLDLVSIPQADEQQRVLANMIFFMNSNHKPLPRFWYFPGDTKAVVIMTGDDHSGGGTVGRFDSYKAESTPGCSVDDWQCIRSTTYMEPGIIDLQNKQMTSEKAALYEADGFEVALHLDTACEDFTVPDMVSSYATQLSKFIGYYNTISRPASLRSHCVVWPDWASQPKVEYASGIRLDTNYYYWPGSWLQNRPGFFTGSGMIMRFADLDGSMIDVYQAVTQMTDESELAYSPFIAALLDNALGSKGYYAAITANMHNDFVTSAGSEAILAAAKARGVPVISARQMLTWLDGRNSSSFQNLAWNGGALTFNISVGTGANRLRAMLPTQFGVNGLVTLRRNGNPVTVTTEVIKGIEYAIFDAQPGSYSAAYLVDTTGPVISDVTPAPYKVSALVSFKTDELANGRIDYGTSPSSLNRNSSTANYSRNHAFTLNSLYAGNTYYYRLTSTDTYGNTSTYPPVGSDPLTFTTSNSVIADEVDTDFAKGTLNGCYVGSGVRLQPAMGQEFTGTSRPSGWTFASSGGTDTYNGVNVQIDRGLLATSGTYTAGRSLEFAGKFILNGSNAQHAGFGTNLSFAPYAIFSSGSPAGSKLLVRTNAGTGEVKTELNLNLSLSHIFRIDWLSDRVDYYVDGALVASHPVTISAQMRSLAGDYTAGNPLTIEFMRLSPYAASCSFQSRVFTAANIVNWDRIAFAPELASLPAGTSYTLSYRTGSTATPDAGWTAFTAVTSGGQLTGKTKYIQYKVDFTTTDTLVTPWVTYVRFYYTDDTIPPVRSVLYLPITIKP